MKRLLFACGDVGGARALLPVIRKARGDGLEIIVLRHGYIGDEPNPTWQWLSFSGAAPEDVRAGLTSANPDAVIFASSMKNDLALTFAREAQAAGIVTVFILDSWSEYRKRMDSDGKALFIPDAYTVPDQLALEGAVADGLPASILHITGQPAFEGPGWYTCPPRSSAAGNMNARRRLLFVAEPVEADQGKARGYTEHDALALLCDSLQPLADSITLEILPHPRHDKGVMEESWIRFRGRLRGDIIAINTAEGALTRYDGITGMASVLLYQGWLLGRPVLSVQPNLRLAPLRQLGQRAGVVLIDQPENAAERIRAWATAIVPEQPIRLRPEALLHDKAVESILSLTQRLVAGSANRNDTP